MDHSFSKSKTIPIQINGVSRCFEPMLDRNSYLINKSTFQEGGENDARVEKGGVASTASSLVK